MGWHGGWTSVSATALEDAMVTTLLAHLILFLACTALAGAARA